MTTLSIQPPFPPFADRAGAPLQNGYIWIGTAALNPITNPIAVYWDAALTQAAAQPIRTQGGYPVNNGTPARLYVGSDYSLLVQDSKGTLVYQAPNATERWSDVVVTGLDASMVAFLQAGTGAQQRTVQSKLNDTFSFQDFGAIGDDSADDTDEMQAAIDYIASIGEGTIYGKPGSTYKITAPLVFKTGVMIDLCGAKIKQYTNNTQIITAPTGSAIRDWGMINGREEYATKQDGTSTVSVTVSGVLNAGDIFIDNTTGAAGKVVSVAGGVLTYLAGDGVVGSGNQLFVNGAAQATTTSASTMAKGGAGIRLAIGDFSYNFKIDRIFVGDALDGIVCPSNAGTFAFVGQITNYTCNVGRWAINYDCDSSVGGNTNVTLRNCWHVHGQTPPAPFSSGFKFNACSMFRWDSLLADKIEGPFVFAQSSSGEMGTMTLEASNFTISSNLQGSPFQLSNSSINVDTLKYIGNTFTTYVTMTVTGVTGTFTAGQVVSAAPSGARGKVVSLSGGQLTVTQDTINANFTAADVLTGPSGTATVSGSPLNNGQIFLFRGGSSTRYVEFSSTVSNFVTSLNNYVGQNIYDASCTSDSASPQSGPFNLYNQNAFLDRATTGINITGTINVGDTITGATSGAAGVVTAIGTFAVQYKPSNSIPWTVGENINVLGVSQGTSLGGQQITAYLADFGVPPQIKTWNGILRDVAPDAFYVSSPGYIGLPQNARTANYTLVMTDAGKSIVHPITDNNARTFTIPGNSSAPFPVGTEITFVNMINTLSIAITSDTMYLSTAGTTGTRTLAAYGVAKAIKVASTTWIISGTGLT